VQDWNTARDRDMTQDTALVLFSGGQDSTVCLAWALHRHARVETIGFDYGQRHAVEMQARTAVLSALRETCPAWARGLGQDHVVDASVLGQVSETALTRDTEIRMRDDGLPNTFVPGRNIVFFTLAAATAYRRGLARLVGGMCETDFSGYPDCRDDTLKALQVSLNLGMASRFVIDTPLMWLDKADTWQLAADLGGAPLVDLIVEHTHTCYLGERGTRHAWGHGCGDCPACRLRAQGYEAYVGRGQNG
jgi:7-cyano-7-deazaguanine synthase